MIHSLPRLFPSIAVLALLGSLVMAPAAVGQPEQPLVPEYVPLDAAAQAAIDAEFLTEDERRALRVFHGIWDQDDLDTPLRRAIVALNAWDFDEPALNDPAVPLELRAEALARQGLLLQAVEMLRGADSNRAARITAEALEALGRHTAAEQAVEGPVRRLLQTKIEDPDELTEGVQALVVRARLQGQPARDYEHMIELLSRAHQELDRLHWPSRLVEARLLIDKDNAKEGIEALHETLALNPRCAEAWFALGTVALSRFDFQSVQLAAERLRLLNPRHPLADLLLAESRLTQDDPDGAADLLRPLLQRLPQLREALALAAAVEALRYDAEAMQVALVEYEGLSPGSARPYAVVGRHLSLNRQYEAAAEMLQEAIRRQPAWPEPRIDLGLMELQSGRNAEALAILQEVVELDPFNKRANNSLHLLRELAGYESIETDHFVIRYAPGTDRIVAELMPGPLEQLHRTVTTRFRHEPNRKTVIELMPDHERFAVRITGMPWIHTIAACTGPVIAMEVPREGLPSLHLGPFDWARVIQHEYTHTVNLSQTRNRIPHWLTEGAAVSMEPAPRDYDTCRLLADAYESGSLFDLEEIKWAFVRPQRPEDRPLAYAEAHWMVEYMNERYGEGALVLLLGYYFEGVREQTAMREALGISRARFHDEFLAWAGGQLRAWGMLPQPPAPTLQELEDELRFADPDLAAVMVASRQARLDAIVNALTDRIGRPASVRSRGNREPFAADRWPQLIRPPVVIGDATLASWLELYPDHPDLVELNLRREIERLGKVDESVVDVLEHYAQVRPVDPYPHQKLAELWLGSETPLRAIPHLVELDSREQNSPVFARTLATLYRQAGMTADALARATRAVQINPYDPPNRELAAAIAIEAGDLELARMHIMALTLLEPDHAQHRKRLEAIDRLIGP